MNKELLEKIKYEVNVGEYSTIKTKDLEIVLKYIEKLETEKQKLIYDLEGAIDFIKTGKDIISKTKVEA